MSAANSGALRDIYPPLQSWGEEVSATFYDRPGPLTAKDRERCIIALVTLLGATLPLAIHIYWGLMEGLSVEEICHTIGLSGCYGGLPKASHGLLVVERTLALLNRVSEAGPNATAVLEALISEFRP
ncbi:MAG TPA: carboxymuconolactone decarboxylase family protein [Polyangiales bacterium]|nr:carboxymuconolactone decarboxylase family protein [Polyangiales bacterium]